MHTQGVVLGEIVKANIPVRNGVVHLIHRPLVIVDTTVVQFLEVRVLQLFIQSIHSLPNHREQFEQLLILTW